MRGIFITIEGIDGCGKSTQAALLKRAIENSGSNVILTREPGGSSLGELIRNALLTKDMNSITEFLLFAADRNEHIKNIIRPSLEEGIVVISDRFTDSSVAYQGYGRGVDIDFIERVHRFITKGLKPDLTILIDVPLEVSIERRMVTKLDRIESEGILFLKRIRDGYLDIAKQEKRFVVVDGSLSVEAVSNKVLDVYFSRREKWIKEES
jgi:dTMP kinase